MRASQRGNEQKGDNERKWCVCEARTCPRVNESVRARLSVGYNLMFRYLTGEESSGL